MARTLLIIDDDAEALDVLVAAAASRGYVAEGIQDSRQALERVHDQQPAAIVLDLQMPHLDGRDVLMRLKSAETTARIPVFILSGRTDIHTRDLCISYGAVAFLWKPVSLGELFACLAAALGESGKGADIGRHCDEDGGC